MLFYGKMMILVFTGALCISNVPVFAQDAASSGSAESEYYSDLKIHPFGMGSFEFGQIVEGQYAHAIYPEKGRLDHYWLQQGLIQLGLETERFKGFRIVLSGEGSLYFPYTLPSDGSGFGYELLGPRFRFYPHHSEGSFSIGDFRQPKFYAGVGYYPFKYNPDATNFGDYLFRVNPYPQYFMTRFDSPYQRLLGLHCNSYPAGGLRLDAMLTSEVNLWPLRDYSLSFLVNFDRFKFFGAGAGVMFDRVFSVDNRLTTPPPEEQEPVGTGFSFAGTKVVTRYAFAPFELIPANRFFNRSDFRIYHEICWNGLKDYPVTDTNSSNYPGYDDIEKRRLFLYGLNWPTNPLLSYTLVPGVLAFLRYDNRFNMPTGIAAGAGIITGVGVFFLERYLERQFRLDRISIEVEYWPNDFANSYWGAYPIGGGYKQNPNPWRYGSRGSHTDPYGPWHWSIYMKKTIYDHIKFMLQFSRDHTVLETSLTGTSNGDPQEAMDGLGNWMWMAKIEYNLKK